MWSDILDVNVQQSGNNVIVFQGAEVCSGDEFTRRIEQLSLNVHWTGNDHFERNV